MTKHFMDTIREERLKREAQERYTRPAPKPIPDNIRQRALLDGLDCLSRQQDLFDSDLATRPLTVWVDATETPDWAKAVLGYGDGEDVDDRS